MLTFASMESTNHNFSLLFRRLLLLLFIYSFCRVLFLTFNHSYFSNVGIALLSRSFFFGLRYDITAIVISNVFFIVLHLLPFRFFYFKTYQRILLVLFLAVNIPMILFNCIDFGLYRFTGKRSGAEIFSIMSFGNDFINTLPRMIFDFWYLLVTFFLLTYILYRYYPRLVFSESIRVRPSNRFAVSPFGKWMYFILFTALTFIGFRGGIQYKPLNILSASQYGIGKTTELVLNTPFTIIKTYGKNKLEDINCNSILFRHPINIFQFIFTIGFNYSERCV